MEIIIEFAQLSDLEKIRLFDPHSQYIDKEKIVNKIIQKEIILAKNEEKIIGIIKFSYFWATRPYIDLIFVDPIFRGHGLSRQLIQFLIEYLKSQDFPYLFSSSEIKEPTAQNWHKYIV